MPSDAYNRFIASMQMNFDKWHDGEGYDLSCIDDLTEEEKKSLATMLRGRDDWRDAEALAALELDAAMDAFEADPKNHPAEGVRAMAESDNPDTRLAAIEALHDAKQITDAELEDRLIKELQVTKPFGGMVRCFFLLDRVPTDRIKRRLLWCTFNIPEHGPNFAGKLWQLCGKSEEEFDWSNRPLFLKFGKHVSDWEKYQAMKELCEQIGMKSEEAA